MLGWSICHSDWVLFVILSMETVKLLKTENVQKSLRLITLINLNIEYKYSDKNNDDIEEEAKKTMDLLYAMQKFEMCVMTFEGKTCQLLMLQPLRKGFIFYQMENQNLPNNQENSYKKSDGNLVFLSPTRVDDSMKN